MISLKFTCIILPAILTTMRANILDGSLPERQIGAIGDNKEQLTNGNPYLYPCTTNNECNNEFHLCAKDGLNSTYWFCACYCGGGPCKQNEDCCTNICDNGICASSGGTQGCICSGTTSECPTGEQCADGYICQQWGRYGYCNLVAQVSPSSTEMPTTILPTTTASISNGNPYLYPCTSNSDCSYYDHSCTISSSYNSSYYFCNCLCIGPCIYNGDCCTNICNNGLCATYGGMQGSVCGAGCLSEEQCADGFVCKPWGIAGYCDLTRSMSKMKD